MSVKGYIVVVTVYNKKPIPPTVGSSVSDIFETLADANNQLAKMLHQKEQPLRSGQGGLCPDGLADSILHYESTIGGHQNSSCADMRTRLHESRWEVVAKKLRYASQQGLIFSPVGFVLFLADQCLAPNSLWGSSVLFAAANQHDKGTEQVGRLSSSIHMYGLRREIHICDWTRGKKYMPLRPSDLSSVGNHLLMVEATGYQGLTRNIMAAQHGSQTVQEYVWQPDPWVVYWDSPLTCAYIAVSRKRDLPSCV